MIDPIRLQNVSPPPMLPFPDIILPRILPTTLHGDHPLEELNFHLGSFVFVHATGFLKHCARPPLGKKKKKENKKVFLGETPLAVCRYEKLARI